MTREQAAESEPVFLGHLALGDEQETRQAGFRRQQVVPAGISPPLAHVVADAQQVSRRIVEEVEIHRRQLVAPGDQTVDDLQPLLRRGSAPGRPLPGFIGNRVRRGHLLQGRELGEVPGFGHQRPQVVAKSAALAIERAGPVAELARVLRGRRGDQSLGGEVELLQQRLRERRCLPATIHRLKRAPQGLDLLLHLGNRRRRRVRGQRQQGVLEAVERRGGPAPAGSSAR